MYDNTVSARTYLSYIAEQAGGIAVIGRDGKLYIKTIGESSATLPLKLFKTFKWGEKFKITRVRYDDGTQLFEKGDTTGNTVYISQDNMYIVDQEQIDNIYNVLKDLEFYSFEGESIIDPALDTGDIVVIDGKNVIYQGSMQFSGRWIANIESKIQCKAKEETTRRIPSQKTINRRVESNINQIDGKITRLTEETTENSQKITKTEQDVNGLTTKVSSVEQSVENITNTQNTATGKNIHLEDSSDDPLVSIKVKGSTNQATRSEKNLLDNTAITKISNGITFTVNSDGTVLADGTNDTTANSSLIINRYDLSPGTYVLNGCPSGGAINTYRLAIQETGSYSVLGSIDIGNGSGEFTLDTTTTVQIAIFIQKGLTINKLLFKPMLRKATIADDTYEQYGASPSPDYPSEVENVEGNVNIQITGKNLFDEEVKIDNKGLAWATGELFNEAGSVSSDFILARDISQIYSNYKFHIYFYDKDKNYLGNSYNLTTGYGVVYDNLILPNNTDIAYFRLWFRKIINDSTDMTIKTDIMITRTQEELTDYEPYKSQTVTFPLVEGQKLMEGSYLADDGIHHKRGQIVLDGTENWGKLWPDSDAKNIFFFEINAGYVMDKNFVGIISNQYVGVNYGGNDGKSLWNLRINDNYKYLIAISYYFTNDNKRLAIKDIDCTTAQEFKAKLAEQYAKGTPVVVEYELAEEEIVPYTEAQQEAWDKIEQLHTYKNVTNIFSDTELDIVYVRDNGLSDMYETKQNANKNYTKTVEKFAEQKITTDVINQKVAVVNEKLTEYKQDIDGFSFATENAGGINLIQNSTLENGLDLYHSTTGTVSIEKNIDVKEKTISKSAIKIINGTVITQEINIIPLEDYTFSCLIYKTELTNVTIKIVSDKIEEYKIEAEPETWQKFSANINSSDNSVIIEIICDNNFCYISDRILNKGNAPLGWQRHNGEFKSDNVTINEDGITVTNTNDNMKHVITSSEDKIINTLNGKTEVSFNPDETKMNSTRINEKLTKGKVRETVRDDGTVMVTMDD